jgi:hypothetical protein
MPFYQDHNSEMLMRDKNSFPLVSMNLGADCRFPGVESGASKEKELAQMCNVFHSSDPTLAISCSTYCKQKGL